MRGATILSHNLTSFSGRSIPTLRMPWRNSCSSRKHRSVHAPPSLCLALTRRLERKRGREMLRGTALEVLVLLHDAYELLRSCPL